MEQPKITGETIMNAIAAADNHFKDEIRDVRQAFDGLQAEIAALRAAVADLAKSSVAGSTEAPRSWNVKCENGFGWEETFTIRGATEAEFHANVQAERVRLADAGYKPLWRGNGKSASAATPAAETPTTENWCGIHGASMSRHDKDGQVWYSHKADNEWCRGKEAKKK